jgi:hypothetical protein
MSGAGSSKSKLPKPPSKRTSAFPLIAISFIGVAVAGIMLFSGKPGGGGGGGGGGATCKSKIKNGSSVSITAVGPYDIGVTLKVGAACNARAAWVQGLAPGGAGTVFTVVSDAVDNDKCMEDFTKPFTLQIGGGYSLGVSQPGQPCIQSGPYGTQPLGMAVTSPGAGLSPTGFNLGTATVTENSIGLASNGLNMGSVAYLSAVQEGSMITAYQGPTGHDWALSSVTIVRQGP